jgi:hypothetical protein
MLSAFFGLVHILALHQENKELKAKIKELEAHTNSCEGSCSGRRSKKMSESI